MISVSIKNSAISAPTVKTERIELVRVAPKLLLLVVVL